MSWLSFYWRAMRIRFFSDVGGSTCGTESARSATTERSSWYWRAQFAHCVRCACAASRSSEVTASSAYAPDSSSNSWQVIVYSPYRLPDLYYDLQSPIDYKKRPDLARSRRLLNGVRPQYFRRGNRCI